MASIGARLRDWALHLEDLAQELLAALAPEAWTPEPEPEPVPVRVRAR